jgi:hypothetical protein
MTQRHTQAWIVFVAPIYVKNFRSFFRIVDRHLLSRFSAAAWIAGLPHTPRESIIANKRAGEIRA